jgi:hypothetical protein
MPATSPPIWSAWWRSSRPLGSWQLGAGGPSLPRQAGSWRLYLSNPIAVSLAGTSYVEPLLALFVTGALFSAWTFRHSGARAWLLLAAAFAGSAAGVKYLGLFFAAAVCIDLIFGDLNFIDPAFGRRNSRRLHPILFALAAFVVLAPSICPDRDSYRQSDLPVSARSVRIDRLGSDRPQTHERHHGP